LAGQADSHRGLHVDHLVFADIRSPQSVQNIEHNPSVEINVVDPLVRKGYRFKGQGIVHRSGDVFQRGCRMYREMGLTPDIRAVVLIRVERAPVFSPAYARGDTEEQVKERWWGYWRAVGPSGRMMAKGFVAGIYPSY
jgi:hypothetical protein